jgi:hypothetical protein
MQTYKTVFCAVAIALCAAPIAALAADPRPCELFSTKEIASVLGVTPRPGQPTMPDETEYDGLAATDWSCYWSAGKQLVFGFGEQTFMVQVSRFRSAADAKRAVKMMVKSITEDKEFSDRILLSEVPGPGEQNFWASSKSPANSGDTNGGGWVSRKGQTWLSVNVMDVDKTMRRENLREQLRGLVASGLRRLP